MMEKINDLIRDKCKKNLLLPDDHLYDDLGLNSLDITELVTDMEFEFDVHVPDERIERLYRVRDFFDLFKGPLSRQEALQ